MTRHLVIFARAPQFGRVKRRLARDVGMPAATRFYRTTLERQIGPMSNDPRWTVWLFVTPDTDTGHPAWRGAVPPNRIRAQGRGDLGQRMLRPFQTLPPGPVVLVGSDIPAMRPRHVERAFRLLGRHDLVFGPARDGGFWLIGARRIRPMPCGLFSDVRWSTEHALADTRANVPAALSTGEADTLADIDTAEDLRRLRTMPPTPAA
ncbi:MAG: TIGR04282 family arsenosugar biosynthesis glycosyltransferase [Rhodospirillales bacterium]|nr:TIGR04282 family arsenosugar biosynthesis glycosyltransferase [Rhodospirillales bacterium]